MLHDTYELSYEALSQKLVWNLTPPYAKAFDYVDIHFVIAWMSIAYFAISNSTAYLMIDDHVN